MKKDLLKDFNNFCKEKNPICSECEYSNQIPCSTYYSYDKGFRDCALKIYDIFCENKKDIEGIAVSDLKYQLLKICGNIE